MKQSERPTFSANLLREHYGAQKETGGVSSRFLQNRSIGQLIVLFIVFMVSVQILNVTLEHFGVTPPFAEREPHRPLSGGFPSN